MNGHTVLYSVKFIGIWHLLSGTLSLIALPVSFLLQAESSRHLPAQLSSLTLTLSSILRLLTFPNSLLIQTESLRSFSIEFHLSNIGFYLPVILLFLGAGLLTKKSWARIGSIYYSYFRIGEIAVANVALFTSLLLNHQATVDPLDPPLGFQILLHLTVLSISLLHPCITISTMRLPEVVRALPGRTLFSSESSVMEGVPLLLLIGLILAIVVLTSWSHRYRLESWKQPYTPSRYEWLFMQLEDKECLVGKGNYYWLRFSLEPAFPLEPAVLTLIVQSETRYAFESCSVEAMSFLRDVSDQFRLTSPTIYVTWTATGASIGKSESERWECSIPSMNSANDFPKRLGLMQDRALPTPELFDDFCKKLSQ